MVGLLLLWSGQLAAQTDNHAMINVRLDSIHHNLPAMEVELLCNSGNVKRQSERITKGSAHDFLLSRFSDGDTICQLTAEKFSGYGFTYSVRGASGFKSDETGCYYKNISDGDAIGCDLEAIQNKIPVTVYKQWIGESGHEPDVEITMDCSSGDFSGRRYINVDSSNGWKVGNIDHEGAYCNISEVQRDSFIGNESDCQDLQIFPGMGAECTMVNTKLVKRITMLNRYGIAAMILVMLTAGLMGVRRYVG
jgi:hypothetical protein